MEQLHTAYFHTYAVLESEGKIVRVGANGRRIDLTGTEMQISGDDGHRIVPITPEVLLPDYGTGFAMFVLITEYGRFEGHDRYDRWVRLENGDKCGMVSFEDAGGTFSGKVATVYKAKESSCAVVQSLEDSPFPEQ